MSTRNRARSSAPQPVKAVQPSRTIQQKEDPKQLLSSLTENAQFGPAIKAVYDRSWQNDFRHYLDANIEAKDVEIRETCNVHYEEFIGSVDSLLAVKKDMADLRAMIKTLNENVKTSGSKLIERAQELSKARLMRHNLGVTLHVLRAVTHVFDLVNKALEQIDAKRYFSALKSITQLQQQHLPRFADFEFCRQLEEQLPVMTQQVREAVKSEFSAWLSFSRARAKNIGALAMTQIDGAVKALDTADRKRRRRRLQQILASAMQSSYAGEGEAKTSSAGLLSPLSFDGAREEEEAEEDEAKAARAAEAFDEESLFEKVDMTFAPVYQCLHVYESLNLAAQFHKMYRDKRLALALQAVEMQSGLATSAFLDEYMGYFANIAGFFVIEDSVAKSGSALMTRTELDGLWDKALAKVKLALSEQLERMASPADFLSVKYTTLLFARTMERYGLSPLPLYDFLLGAAERFERLLLLRLRQEVRDVLDQEKFEPLTVANHAEYQTWVLAFSLHDASVHVSFPATMPFSVSVPHLCRVLRNFVNLYFEFAAHLPAPLEAAVAKALNAAILAEVDAALNALLDRAVALHISQAVQLSINAAYLGQACIYFQHYLASFSEPAAGEDVRVQPRLLPAHEAFARTRMRCEDLLYELIDNKLDQFLALIATIDWMPATPRASPSDVVTDLVAYLETTLTCLVFVPDQVREAVHFTSCRHITAAYMGMLLNQVKKFNQVAVYNLEKDVSELEAFALRCPVAGLAEFFSELRQFVMLMLSGDVESFAEADVRAKLYPQLDVGKLIKILDKFKELGLFTTMPAGVPPLKRKAVDNLIGKLKKVLDTQGSKK